MTKFIKVIHFIIFSRLILWIPKYTGLREIRVVGSGFPPTLENLENLEKWDNFFQSGKSQGILKKY